MASKKRDPEPGRTVCPMTTATTVIGGKWKPLILSHLLQGHAGAHHLPLHAIERVKRSGEVPLFCQILSRDPVASCLLQ